MIYASHTHTRTGNIRVYALEFKWNDVTGITRVDLPPVGHMFLSCRHRSPHAPHRHPVVVAEATAAAPVYPSMTAAAAVLYTQSPRFFIIDNEIIIILWSLFIAIEWSRNRRRHFSRTRQRPAGVLLLFSSVRCQTQQSSSFNTATSSAVSYHHVSRQNTE